MDPMVRMSGVRKAYGGVQALAGLDLEVARGGICAVLGPNGAGKTTALRTLATLVRPDAGTATVAGLDVVRRAAQVRGRIGLAGQHAAVDDDLTGTENLVLLGRFHHLGRRRARARAAELLEAYDLADAAGRLVGTWSGGMRRRLDLIASLVVDPPVLFLDEPTTGLDPAGRAALWQAVQDLRDRGTTVLLTTQYLEEADRLADDIVIIAAGRVVAQGSPAALKDAVGARVEVVLTDDRGLPAAAALLAGIALAPPEVAGPERRVGAAVPAGAVTLPELVRMLDAAGLGLEDAAVRRPTLDQVFLDRVAAA